MKCKAKSRHGHGNQRTIPARERKKREMHMFDGTFYVTIFFSLRSSFFDLRKHIEFFRLALPKHLCPGGRISIACDTPFFFFVFFLCHVDLQHRRSKRCCEHCMCCARRTLPKTRTICVRCVLLISTKLGFNFFCCFDFFVRLPYITSFDAPIPIYVALTPKKLFINLTSTFLSAQPGNRLWEKDRFGDNRTFLHSFSRNYHLHST